MKEYLKYYYSIQALEIKKIKSDKFLIRTTEKVYVFKKVYKNEVFLEDIEQYCNQNNIKRNKIVRNNLGTLISIYLSEHYVLINLKYIKEVLDYNSLLLPIDGYISISNIWDNKIKSLEKKLLDKKDLPVEIKGMYIYYIMLAETALIILEKYEKTIKSNLYIQNERIYYPNLACNYLDQSTFVIDYKGRNAAEYIKSKLLSNKITKKEIMKILSAYNYNSFELIYILCRIIYPTYFFDIFEKEYDKEKLFDKVKKIYDKRKDFYSTYMYMYEYLKYYNINIDIFA